VTPERNGDDDTYDVSAAAARVARRGMRMAVKCMMMFGFCKLISESR
jgi:hypothetical protein